MKIFLSIVVSAIVTGSITLAQPPPQEPSYPIQNEEKTHADISHECNLDYSYSAKATLRQGSRDVGQLDSQDMHARYVLSYPLADGDFLRLGANYEQFSFGVPTNVPLPNTLRSVAPVIGADIELSDSWLLRVEMEPGIYSDFEDISIDDVNIPTVIGASYLVDKDLQWFFGISIDPRRSFLPVMPGVGVRWKFEDQWTLFFVLPNPQIQYEINKDLMAYIGASIRGGNYQVSQGFGTDHGRTDLDNDNVEYREIRTGLGAKWKAIKGMEIGVEGGWMIDRRFTYDQEDLTFHTAGAPYGQISISAAF